MNGVFDCYVPIETDDRDEFIQDWIDINRLSFFGEEEKLDFPFYTVEDVKQGALDGRFFEYVYRKFREKDINCFHVFSLSKKEMNQVLWGTYADSYKGMCLCYKAEYFYDDYIGSYYGLKIHDVKFKRGIYFSNVCDDTYLNIYDVNYSDKLGLAYDCIANKHMFSYDCYDAIDEIIRDSLFKKSLDWKHEEECRGIFCENKRGNDINNRLYYCDEVLDSISFGFNTSENDITSIKDIVRSNFKNADNIKFFKVVPDY